MASNAQSGIDNEVVLKFKTPDYKWMVEKGIDPDKRYAKELFKTAIGRCPQMVRADVEAAFKEALATWYG